MACFILLYTFVIVLNYDAVLSENVYWMNKYFDRSSEVDPEPVLPYIKAEKPNNSPEPLDNNKESIKPFSNSKNEEEEEAEVVLNQMLRVLQRYFARKPPQNKISNKFPFDSKRGPNQNIAWSYYDDVGK
ncbi:uncharacterized protein LOC111361365 [Spodoptera litura]|uniref:Uncharacterized protein LOC111361365 n=1 Tax=Spodoptera litura TaxID=69820 RepID=A0A9J7ELY4_SPOLT|nr:uncharacterized protein LOC111361365 [Spodoptera litura]